MNNTEVWKDIPNYEGIYQVSNLGNVKSLSRKMKKGNAIFFSNEKILKPIIKGPSYSMYYSINLYKIERGKPKTMKVHVLVAQVFLGHNPDGTHRICVDHINNNPLDNRLENLQLISHRENLSKDKKNKSSKYTGVSWDKTANKWRSQIRIENTRIYLGCFADEHDAHLAYQNKLNEILK